MLHNHTIASPALAVEKEGQTRTLIMHEREKVGFVKGNLSSLLSLGQAWFGQAKVAPLKNFQPTTRAAKPPSF